MKKLIYIYVCILGFSLSACKKSVDPAKFPESNAELAKSVEITKDISSKSEQIISTALSKSSFDKQGVLDQIKGINNVKNAYFNSSESLIVIEQKNGVYTNLFVNNMADAGQFSLKKNETNPIKVNSFYNDQSNYHLSSIGNHISTLGHKALLICPFQDIFNENTTFLDFVLTDIGYSVDHLFGYAATLESFKGDNLQKYDIIYISTHAGAEAVTSDGSIVTGFATGEKYDPDKLSQMPDALRKATGSCKPGGQTESYFLVSADYIKATLTKKFPNSWVFINACQSSKESDLSSFFLQSGALGYSGFKDNIEINLSSCIAQKMFASFASGYEFTAANDVIKSDPGFRGYSFVDKIFHKSINVDLFTSERRLNDPFYVRNEIFGEVIFDLKPAHAGDKVTVGMHLWNTYNNVDPRALLHCRDQFVFVDVNPFMTSGQITLINDSKGAYPSADNFVLQLYDKNSNTIGYCYNTLILSPK